MKEMLYIRATFKRAERVYFILGRSKREEGLHRKKNNVSR